MEDYLVQMGIDDALEKEKTNNIKEEKGTQIKKAVRRWFRQITNQMSLHSSSI